MRNEILFDEITHQANTALFFIRWYTEQYKETPTPENKQKLDQEVQHLDTIVNQIEHQPENNCDIDVLSLLEKTREVLNNSSKKQITFETNTDKTLHSNPFYCEELFRILLDNALKHSSNESQISCALLTCDNAFSVSIKNTGYGLSKAEQSLIWAPHSQIDTNKTGSGLGLSIAKKIAEKNNCTIHCQSDGKTYTEFILTFPQKT